MQSSSLTRRSDWSEAGDHKHVVRVIVMVGGKLDELRQRGGPERLQWTASQHVGPHERAQIATGACLS